LSATTAAMAVVNPPVERLPSIWASPKAKTPPPRVAIQYPPESPVAAIESIGSLGQVVRVFNEPWKTAVPSAKTPPEALASQVPPPLA
jgi:hypothetical protein